MSAISRVPWRTRAALAIVFALLLTISAVAQTFAFGGSHLKRISSDPYTNSTSQHKSQVEPDTFAFGSTIVSIFQSGRFFDGGSSDIGWATSTDNGATWHHGFLPDTTVYSTPPGPYARITDPAVSYDPKHGLWIAFTLALDTNGIGVAVLVSQSPDGLNWGNPVVVKSASGSDFFDKTWGTCDTSSSSPHYGNCYAEWDNFGLGDLIQMSTSTDGGNTWGAPLGTADSAFGSGGEPLVQPNGNVIVPIDDPFSSSVNVFTSTNGGTSWSSLTFIDSIIAHFPNGGVRNRPFISAAMDSTGKIYVVWEDCRFESGCPANDIVMISSSDGISWSAVTRVPADPVGSGVEHLFPTIAADTSKSGGSTHLAIEFYYYTNTNCTTCSLIDGYVSSPDGGATWTTTRGISGAIPLTWLAVTNQGPMVGDYLGIAIVNHRAYPTFPSAKAPVGSTLSEDMYTIQGGLDASSALIKATTGPVLYHGHGSVFGRRPSI